MEALSVNSQRINHIIVVVDCSVGRYCSAFFLYSVNGMLIWTSYHTAESPFSMKNELYENPVCD